MIVDCACAIAQFTILVKPDYIHRHTSAIMDDDTISDDTTSDDTTSFRSHEKIQTCNLSVCPAALDDLLVQDLLRRHRHSDKITYL